MCMCLCVSGVFFDNARLQFVGEFVVMVSRLYVVMG